MEADEVRLRNQQEFRELLEKLGITTQAQAAKELTRLTGRPISVRAIKTWMAAPTAVTAAPLPDWAISNLKKMLE